MNDDGQRQYEENGQHCLEWILPIQNWINVWLSIPMKKNPNIHISDMHNVPFLLTYSFHRMRNKYM